MTVSNATATWVAPPTVTSAWSVRNIPRVAPTSTPLRFVAGGAPKNERKSSYVPSTRWTFIPAGADQSSTRLRFARLADAGLLGVDGIGRVDAHAARADLLAGLEDLRVLVVDAL